MKIITDSGEVIEVLVSEPTVPEAKVLKFEDVWGDQLGRGGLIVARRGDRCPEWYDIIDRKQVTVVCDPSDEQEVIYWLEFCFGANCVIKRKAYQDGSLVALRAQYMCD